MTDFKDKLNLIGYALMLVSVLLAALAIPLSKKGKRTSLLTILSYICLVGFLITGYYRIQNLASGNNWTALIQDVTIRSKASVILAILVVIATFIPFFTYLTPEDARIREEQERKAREFRRQQKEAAELEVAEQARQAQNEAKDSLK